MKRVIVHLAGAGITGLIILAIAGLFPKIGQYVSDTSNLLEGLLLLIPFVLAFALYTFISQLHNFLNYLWFIFTPERKVCGLFVESYFINNEPRLALLVVYFDIHDEELKLKGYSYRWDSNDKSKLMPSARWESKATHHEPHEDDFDLFNIHLGAVDKSTIRGTTICKLPLHETLCRMGAFCDLEFADSANLIPQTFEIIRARKAHQKEFRREMPFLVRCEYSLKLRAPPEHVFQSFAFKKRATLLEPFEGAFRGINSVKIWKTMQ
jgi:hypothetical protein